MQNSALRASLSLVGFVATAVLANVATANLGLVPIGLGLSVTAGTFFAGLALVLRDAVHETAGVRWVYPAVLVGALLTAVTAGPALALASGLAFAVSEGADGAVYGWLREKSRAVAVLASGVVGLVLDTFVFLAIAGFPITTGTVVGQVVVKGGFSLAVAAYLARRQ